MRVSAFTYKWCTQQASSEQKCSGTCSMRGPSRKYGTYTFLPVSQVLFELSEEAISEPNWVSPSLPRAAIAAMVHFYSLV